MSDLNFDPAEMRARGFDPASIAEAERAAEARAKARELVADIEGSFTDIARPKITRSVARGYDDEWTLSEARIAELASCDPETDWRTIPDAAIEQCQEYFCFSDAEGYRFYLPAYMRHYLQEFPYSAWYAVQSAARDSEKLSLLTEQQKSCVTRFLALCSEYQE